MLADINGDGLLDVVVGMRAMQKERSNVRGQPFRQRRMRLFRVRVQRPVFVRSPPCWAEELILDIPTHWIFPIVEIQGDIPWMFN